MHHNDPRSEKKSVAIPDHAFFRHLCEHSGVALISVDCQGAINAWNQAAGRLFGAGERQMIGEEFLHVLPHETREEASRLLEAALHEREVRSFEFHHRDIHGETRYLLVTISPILDHLGEILGASAFIGDITERINLQNELAQNRKMASLGTLAGGVAHHFNNIFGGILTRLDFALGKGDPEAEHAALARACETLLRASQMVKSLLAFAEGDRTHTDVQDITELLSQTVERTRRQLSPSSIELRARLDRIPVFEVPSAQTSEVLDQLISNACDVMPDGGILGIELEQQNDEIVIRIADNGPGIAPETLDRIFEPFNTTWSDVRSSQSAHQGLGLAVAHGIVQYMGGRITVNSILGKGATFEVHLKRIGNQDPKDVTLEPRKRTSGVGDVKPAPEGATAERQPHS